MVLTSPPVGHDPQPREMDSIAGKAGIVGLVRCLGLARTGTTVNARIRPGFIAAEMTAAMRDRARGPRWRRTRSAGPGNPPTSPGRWRSWAPPTPTTFITGHIVGTDYYLYGPDGRHRRPGALTRGQRFPRVATCVGVGASDGGH